MRFSILVAVVALVGVPAAGCHKITGVDELSIVHQADGGTPTCSGGTSACATCVQAKCCAQAAACTSSSACTACVTADAPAASCGSDPTVTAYDACAKNSCNADCF